MGFIFGKENNLTPRTRYFGLTSFQVGIGLSIPIGLVRAQVKPSSSVTVLVTLKISESE